MQEPLPFTFDATAVALVRQAYARQMVTMAGAEKNSRLEDAFAAVPREDFLGPAPWLLGRWPHGLTPVADPVLAYQDVLFALAPTRGVNNGSPSLHARWLDRLAPRPGGRVAHLGIGSGYYTAILAHLVGPEGCVEATEINPELAAMARTNLRGSANVVVRDGDAASLPDGTVDAIYANFMVGRPPEAWLDRLALGGRLLLPIGFLAPVRALLDEPAESRRGVGAGFLITRVEHGFAATWLGPASFVYAEGTLAGSEEDKEGFRAAVKGGRAKEVRSLILDTTMPSERCWFSGNGWALCYDEA